MTEITNAYDWNGRTVIGSDGEKIGRALQGHPIIGGKALGERADCILA